MSKLLKPRKCESESVNLNTNTTKIWNSVVEILWTSNIRPLRDSDTPDDSKLELFKMIIAFIMTLKELM